MATPEKSGENGHYLGERRFMNLIQRTTLHYQGNSESIYEVNLWEVEEEKYDVSFVYIEFNNYSTAGTKSNQQQFAVTHSYYFFYAYISLNI